MNISELLISIVNKVKELKPFKSAVNSVYSWLEERVRGSEDGTIPTIELPKPQSAENIEENINVLNNRIIGINAKIGEETLVDGFDFFRLLLAKKFLDTITELYDTNINWILESNRSTTQLLPNNLSKLTLNCSYIIDYYAQLPASLREIYFPELLSWGITSEGRPNFIYKNNNIKELNFPKLEAVCTGFTYDTNHQGCFISLCDNLKKVYFPSLKKFGESLTGGYHGSYGVLIHSCPNLEELYMPMWNGYKNWRIVRNSPNLKKIVLGDIQYNVPSLYSDTSYTFSSAINLIHFEVKCLSTSLLFNGYKPSNALITEDLYENITNEDGTITSTLVAKYNSLVEEGEPFKNNLEKFLYNFQHYIADRVIDRTGQKTLTLTLSTPVYEALENQEGQTILATLTAKNWTVAQK